MVFLDEVKPCLMKGQAFVEQFFPDKKKGGKPFYLFFPIFWKHRWNEEILTSTDFRVMEDRGIYVFR